MFREIRTSERITDEDERKKRRLMAFDPDKRITKANVDECNKFWEEEFRKEAEETFDPDKRI